MTLASIDAADPKHPTVKPVPYTGVQFVAIPEFQGLGDTVGQIFSAALAGQSSVDDALEAGAGRRHAHHDQSRLHQVGSSREGAARDAIDCPGSLRSAGR